MPSKRPLVMTFWLWRMFYCILPQHPIFWRKLLQRKTPPPPLTRRAKIRRVLIGFVATVLMIPTLLILSLVLGVAAVVLVLFGGLVSGLQAALGVGAAVAAEYQLRRGEQIALAPAGAAGLCWALGARHIRTNKTSLRLRRLIVAGILFGTIGLAFVGIVNFAVVILIGVNATNPDTVTPAVNGLELFVPLINAAIVLAVLYVDLIQSTVLGLIAGMVAGYRTAERGGALWLAAGLFLGVQLAFYVFAALVIRAGALVVTPFEGMLLTMLQASVILLVREVMMHGAIYWTEHTLNTDWAELVTMPRLRG